MSDPPKEVSRGVRAFALFVRGLVRYGWIPILGVLLIAWLLDWGSWRQILAVGIGLALVVLASPMLLGVVVALDSRRRAKLSVNDDHNPGENDT